MAGITQSRDMRIGEVSRLTGVNIETIRYYERTGIVPPPARAQSGQRTYGDADMRRLSFVRRARQLGFSLDEIRRLLDLANGSAKSCEEVFQITADHLTAVRARITDLRRMASVLETMASQCSRGAIPMCPIIDTLFDSAPS